MSLQAKILIIVLAVVGLYAAVDYGSQRLFVLPSFISLERTEAENTIRRCTAAVKREISNLDRLTQELAASDTIHQFVKNRSDSLISTHLTAECFKNLNLVYICDEAGKVLWGTVRDIRTKEVIQLDEFPSGSWPKTHPLLGHETGECPVAGIYITRQGPMLVASSPVGTAGIADPSPGRLVAGRFLDNSVLQALAEQTSVDFKVRSVRDSTVPEEDKRILTRLESESKFHIRELSDKQLSVYAVLSDIRGNPALLMRADLPRDIRSKAIAASIWSNLLSNLTTGLIVVFVLWLLLRNTVVGPISKLTRHVMAVGSSDNALAPLTFHRRDEIGALAREFDRMVEQLAESRKKLSEQCYLLGKAEVASGVLHNARNVLTPLLSRIASLREKLHAVPVERIETAQDELEQTTVSDRRRQDLSRFLNLSNKSLVAFVRAAKDKLDDIAKLVTQIEEMLHQQGRFSHAQLPAEQVKLDDLVRDSIALLPNALSETVSIEMDPSVEAIEPMTVQSITILQVFSNILLNAAESIRRAGSPHGHISIRAKTEKVDGANMVHVEVEDDGDGIEPDNLTRIFERGFSTKHNIPSGMGLHWCANAVATMRGLIYAESRGTGYGACLHILLPTSQKARCLLKEKAEVKS